MGLRVFRVVVFYCLIILVKGCSSDNTSDRVIADEDLVVPSGVIDDQDTVDPEKSDDVIYPLVGETGEILRHERSLSERGYVLVNDPGSDRVYLMDKDNAIIVQEWKLQYGLGNDAELLPNGKLLVSLGVESPSFSFGGFGGIIQIINPDSSIDWEFEYSNENHLIHHDVEMLPNGNILAITWDVRALEEARSKGYVGSEEKIYTESIIEIDPTTNEIVWRWDSWDHLVQDADDTIDGYGIVNESPELININFIDELRMSASPDGDIMHANGLDFDRETNLIYLSVNFYSEVWVIDHSTTTKEAQGSSGGNYNKGGDLVYRFGNPSAYENDFGERLFYNNHFPNILNDGEPVLGNMLIYVNGNGEMQQSIVYELKIPSIFSMEVNANNELEVVWEFTKEGMYSPKVSGAVRLGNGNTLITSGSTGIIEVTHEKEIVWEFEGTGFYWRGYHYETGNDALRVFDFKLP